jgi:hypothetical protein
MDVGSGGTSGGLRVAMALPRLKIIIIFIGRILL